MENPDRRSGRDVDVAVIGAGLSGLTAAWALQRGGRSVVVFEARDRVGGRTWNMSTPGGRRVERGGQWVGPTQDRILALAEEMGVGTFEQYMSGESRILIEGFDASARAEADRVFGELERMAAEIPLDAPWTAEHALDWDAQTLHTWLAARAGSPAAAAYVHVNMAELFTAEPAEVSLLHVLIYVRSAGSCDHLIHAAQERRFVDGSQEISVRLAGRLGAGAVRLRSPVRRLTQDGSGVLVEADGATVTAQRAIVAVPIALTERIVYEPRLSVDLSQLHQRVTPGRVFKVHCIYDGPFWRRLGWSGFGVSDTGFVSVTFDDSPPSGTPGIIVGFVEADNARRFSRLPPTVGAWLSSSRWSTCSGRRRPHPTSTSRRTGQTRSGREVATVPTCPRGRGPAMERYAVIPSASFTGPAPSAPMSG